MGFAIVNGLATGMAMFLVAAGVTLIFGVLHVLNFSHGAFFMLGAYVTFSLIGSSTSVIMLLVMSTLGGLFVGACGYLVEILILRRLRGVDEHYVFIATFALMMVVTGAIKLVWGLDYFSINAPDALSGVVVLAGILLPTYSIFVICVGLFIFVCLEIGLHRTRVGKLVQSLVRDRWMVGLFGYNVPALYAVTVVLAFFLAGFAGGILLPNQSLSPSLGETYVLLAFVTVIIGGLGNIRGAFIAALILGLTESVSAQLNTSFPGLAVYGAMVITLLVRPHGLFAAADTSAAMTQPGSLFRWNLRSRLTAKRQMRNRIEVPFAGRSSDRRLSDRVVDPLTILMGALLALGVITLPLWANQGLIYVAGSMLISGMFALSWHLLFGYAGITSFGHAAFFALGAYFVGFTLKAGIISSFPVALGCSAVLGALLAAIVGALTLGRSSGIYFAILTMALAEICHLIVGRVSWLGGDDGISGINRPTIGFGSLQISLGSDVAYYYFLCVVMLLTIAALWWLLHGRFGRMLRSIQQDPERSAFLGVNVFVYRLAAFIVSGTVASVSGALLAPWSQIVTPEYATLFHSTAPILSSLLGGVASFWGPLIGTVAYSIIGYGTRNFAGVSEIVVGVILLGIVLLAPRGLIGLVYSALAWLRSKPIVRQSAAGDVRP